jgi:hypothetical protein
MTDVVIASEGRERDIISLLLATWHVEEREEREGEEREGGRERGRREGREIKWS